MGRPRKVQIDTPKNGPDPETIASYVRKITDQEDAVAVAKIPYDSERGRLRTLWKGAKTDGVDIDALQQLIKDTKQDTEKRLAKQANYFRYAAIMNLPVGTQLDLFGFEVPDQVRTDNDRHAARRAGAKAGQRGENRTDSNPHDPASELFVAFDDGWMSAQTAMVNGLAPAPQTKPRRTGGGEVKPEPALHVAV